MHKQLHMQSCYAHVYRLQSGRLSLLSILFRGGTIVHRYIRVPLEGGNNGIVRI